MGIQITFNLKKLILLITLTIYLCQVSSPVQGAFYNTLKGRFYSLVGWELNFAKPLCDLAGPEKSHEISPDLIFITKYVLEETVDQAQDEKIADSTRNKHFTRLNPTTYGHNFKPDNVTLKTLEEQGFNKSAPVTFIIHGFTSGYPQQSWMTAMVESFTINQYKLDTEDSSPQVTHNVFVVNWAKGARSSGKAYKQASDYAKAVANLQIVAEYVANFTNTLLIDEAKISSSNIEIIGHSLGAQMAGFIGKKTNAKLGRIYGLDPAGPCFGKFHEDGWSYQDQRLNPNDAQKVITVHTNSEVFGIGAPLGHYSIYVEGGSVQPNCKSASDVIYSLLKLDTSEFNKVSCSHSRAPLLLTSHLGSFTNDDCQLVSYECPYKDGWKQFEKGLCGVCNSSLDGASNLLDALPEPEEIDESEPDAEDNKSRSPLEPVRCTRIGLEWQYGSTSETSLITPWKGQGQSKKKPIKHYIKTTNTQPYCAYHYQVVLKLSEPLTEADVPMSLVLQDAKKKKDSSQVEGTLEPSRQALLSKTRNSLTSDNIVNKLSDGMTYTKLITSTKRISRAEHATLIIRKFLKDVDLDKFKTLYVNYMSSIDDQVRQNLSSKLCRVSVKSLENIPDTMNDENSGQVVYFSTKCES